MAPALHSLKVKTAGATPLMEIDSRRGYYAPKSQSDPAATANWAKSLLLLLFPPK
jgi:hypothetical protein